ncbi:MAG: cytochrome c oxidase subunit 4 [Bacteroidota bacterium]
MKKESYIPVYSFWPLFLATEILMLSIGIVWTWGISILGLLLMFASIIGWVWENRAERTVEEYE